MNNRRGKSASPKRVARLRMIPSHPGGSRGGSPAPAHSKTLGIPLSVYMTSHHDCVDETLSKLSCVGSSVCEIDVDPEAAWQAYESNGGRIIRDSRDSDSGSLMEQELGRQLAERARLQRQRRINASRRRAPYGMMDSSVDQVNALPSASSRVNLSIASTVHTLLLSRNLLEDISGLLAFRNVVSLSLQSNRIRSIHQCAPLQFLPRLELLSLEYNPVTQLPLYRQHVIAICDRRSSSGHDDSSFGDANGSDVKCFGEEMWNAGSGKRKMPRAMQSHPSCAACSVLLRRLDDRPVTESERAAIPAALRKEQAFLLSAMQDYIALVQLDAARQRLMLHSELIGKLIQRGVAVPTAQHRAWHLRRPSGGGIDNDSNSFGAEARRNNSPELLATYSDGSFQIGLFLKLCATAIAGAIPPCRAADAIRREVVTARTSAMATNAAAREPCQFRELSWEDAFAAVASTLHSKAINSLLALEQATASVSSSSSRNTPLLLRLQQSTNSPETQLFFSGFQDPAKRATSLQHWYRWYKEAASRGDFRQQGSSDTNGNVSASNVRRECELDGHSSEEASASAMSLRENVLAQMQVQQGLAGGRPRATHEPKTEEAGQRMPVLPVEAKVRQTGGAPWMRRVGEPDALFIERLQGDLRRVSQREAELHDVNRQLKVHVEEYRQANDLAISRVSHSVAAVGSSRLGDTSAAIPRSDAPPVPLPYPSHGAAESSPQSLETVSHSVIPYQDEKESFLNHEIDCLRDDAVEKTSTIQSLSHTVAELEHELWESQKNAEQNRSIVTCLEGEIVRLKEEIAEVSRDVSQRAGHASQIEAEQYQALRLNHEFTARKRMWNAMAVSFFTRGVRRRALQFWRMMLHRRLFLRRLKHSLWALRDRCVALHLFQVWHGGAQLSARCLWHRRRELEDLCANCFTHWRSQLAVKRAVDGLQQRWYCRMCRCTFDKWKHRSSAMQWSRQRDADCNSRAEIVSDHNRKHQAMERWVERLRRRRIEDLCRRIRQSKASDCMKKLILQARPDADATAWCTLFALLPNGSSSHLPASNDSALSLPLASQQSPLPEASCDVSPDSQRLFPNSSLENAAFAHKFLLLQRWKSFYRTAHATRLFKMSRWFFLWKRRFREAIGGEQVACRARRSAVRWCFQSWLSRLLHRSLTERSQLRELQEEVASHMQYLEDQQSETTALNSLELSVAQRTKHKLQCDAICSMERHATRRVLRRFFFNWVARYLQDRRSQTVAMCESLQQIGTRRVRKTAHASSRCLQSSTRRTLCQRCFSTWNAYRTCRRNCRAIQDESNLLISQLAAESTQREKERENDRVVAVVTQSQQTNLYGLFEEDDMMIIACAHSRRRELRSLLSRWLRCALISNRQKVQQLGSQCIDLQEHSTEVSTENVKLVHRLHDLAQRLAQSVIVNEELSSEGGEKDEAIRDLAIKHQHASQVRAMQERAIATLQQQLRKAAYDNLSLHTAFHTVGKATTTTGPMDDEDRDENDGANDSNPRDAGEIVVVHPHTLGAEESPVRFRSKGKREHKSHPVTAERRSDDDDNGRSSENYSPSIPRQSQRQRDPVPFTELQVDGSKMAPSGRNEGPPSRALALMPIGPDSSVFHLLKRAEGAKERLQAREQFLLQCKEELERLSKICMS